MARTLTIELEVENSGAVSGVRQVGAEMGDLRTQVSATGSDLRESFADLQRRSEILAGGLDDVAIRADRSFEIARQGAIDYSNAVENARASTGRMGGLQRRTNNLLFEFAAATQDVQFGLRGVGNNIGILIETWGRWNRQIPSTKSRWDVLLGALKTPAGIFVVAQLAFTVSTLIQQMGLLEGVFDDNADAAEDFKEQAREIVEATAEFDFEDPQTVFETPEDLAEAVSAARDQVLAQEDAVEAAEQRKEEAEDRLNSASQLTPELAAQVQRAETMLEIEQRQLDQAEARFDVLSGRLGQLENATNEAEKQEALGGDIKDDQEDTTESTFDQAEAEREIAQLLQTNAQRREQARAGIDGLLEAARQRSQFEQAVADARRRVAEAEPPQRQRNLLGEDPLGELNLQTFREELGEAFNTIERGEMVTAELRDRLREATSEEQRDRLRRLIREYERFFEVSEETEKIQVDLERVLSTLAIQASGALANIVTGAKEANKVVQDLIASMAQAAGAALIQSGRFELGIPLLLGGQIVGQFQEGTDFFPGGVGLFGEGGPELAAAPRGTRVFNNEDTRSILSSLASGDDPRTRSRNLESEIRKLGERIENIDIVVPVEDVVNESDRFRDRRNRVSVQP